MFKAQFIVIVFAGTFLMAFCGNRLGELIGHSNTSLWLAGFAVGVLLLGQAPAAALASRIAKLERELERIAKSNTNS